MMLSLGIEAIMAVTVVVFVISNDDRVTECTGRSSILPLLLPSSAKTPYYVRSLTNSGLR